MHRLTEDMVMEFLPPRVEGGVSYCCRCERPGVNRWTAYILENPAGLSKILDLLPGLEEFMQKQSRGHLATSKLPSHHVGLIVFISNAWVDDDVKDFQKSSILAISFKRRTHKGELNCHYPNKGAKEDFGSL
jgi:hypothetical protein